MGAGLAKNKLSPEPSKRTPRGVISVAPPPTLSSKSERDVPEDEFLEKIANNYMKRDRKSFHQGGTTYAGVDLRLEVDCVDVPATVEVCLLCGLHTRMTFLAIKILILCSLRCFFFFFFCLSLL
jgi:hypothetical protein